MEYGVDNAAGYEQCGHDKNGLGRTWKKDTVVVVGLGRFCSKLRLLCYAPMLATTSYYALHESQSNGNNHRFAYLPRLGANATSCTGSKTIPTML